MNTPTACTTRPRKRWSQAEVHARYAKALGQYIQLGKSQDNVREQRMMLFAEVKLLGWVLGKRDKDVANELNQK